MNADLVTSSERLSSEQRQSQQNGVRSILCLVEWVRVVCDEGTSSEAALSRMPRFCRRVTVPTALDPFRHTSKGDLRRRRLHVSRQSYPFFATIDGIMFGRASHAASYAAPTSPPQKRWSTIYRQSW